MDAENSLENVLKTRLSFWVALEHEDQVELAVDDLYERQLCQLDEYKSCHEQTFSFGASSYISKPIAYYSIWDQKVGGRKLAPSIRISTADCRPLPIGPTGIEIRLDLTVYRPAESVKEIPKPLLSEKMKKIAGRFMDAAIGGAATACFIAFFMYVFG